MEIREFADQILFSAIIAEKLVPIVEPVTDQDRGGATSIDVPARTPELVFGGRKQSPPMPHPNTLADPRKRAVAHHIMANHELQALEVMALTLRAFPDEGADFRRGLVAIMLDEQRHTRWHIERLTDLGMTFGEIPVNGYFWKKAQEFQNTLDYLAGLSLTFEGRNLDHTLEFEQYFLQAGDERSAGIMRAIHRDEIRHVAFGMHWLRILKPADQSDWDAWQAHLKFPLRAEKAKGKVFDRESRLAAGLSPEFIDRLEKS